MIIIFGLFCAQLTRNIDGTIYVKISNPFPVANKREDRNRHFFASESNFLPCFEAQNILETFPNASFSTQVVAAAIPILLLLNPNARRRACVPNTLLVAETNR